MWDGIPPNFKWVAVDGDGRAFAYEDEPVILSDFAKKVWVHSQQGASHKYLNLTFKFSNPNSWKKAKIKRP